MTRLENPVTALIFSFENKCGRKDFLALVMRLENPDMALLMRLENPDMTLVMRLENPDMALVMRLENPDTALLIRLESPEMVLVMRLESPDMALVMRHERWLWHSIVYYLPYYKWLISNGNILHNLPAASAYCLRLVIDSRQHGHTHGST